MAVSSRSNDSPLARNGTLSSNAAWRCGAPCRRTIGATRLRPSRERRIRRPRSRARVAPRKRRCPPPARGPRRGETLRERRPRGPVGLVRRHHRAQLIHDLSQVLAEPPRPLPHSGADFRARLGGKERSESSADGETHQEGADCRAGRPSALVVAHSPASRSSGAATAAVRGAACESSGGFTNRSVAARVFPTFSCSKRNENVFSRSAPMARRTSAGRSQNFFLKGPIAFFRLL